jgi:hypothetical protein
VLTDGRHGLNGALEAVERVPRASRDYLECLVVFIAANFAFRHEGLQISFDQVASMLSISGVLASKSFRLIQIAAEWVPIVRGT